MSQSIHDRIMSRQQSDDAEAKPSRSDRKWLRTGVFSLLGAVVIAAAAYGVVRFDALGSFLSQAAIAETNQAAPQLADTPFLEHAKQAGLETCSTVFPALGELLTNGSQYSVQSIWSAEAADEHAVQALVGMNYATEGYSGPAAGVVIAAPTGSLCEGSMIRVAPFSKSCADIPAALPEGSKITNNLGNVAVYELGNGGNAMLLPAGSGCIVISVASAAK